MKDTELITAIMVSFYINEFIEQIQKEHEEKMISMIQETINIVIYTHYNGIARTNLVIYTATIQSIGLNFSKPQNRKNKLSNLILKCIESVVLIEVFRYF